VAVYWPEPIASDNIAVDRIERTAVPGSNFSLLESPHQVTYTAYDSGGRTAVCQFSVVVNYVAAAFVVTAPLRETLVRRETRLDGLPFVQDEHQLLEETAESLSFTADLGLHNAFQIKLFAPGRDVVEVGPYFGGQFGQIVVKLRWEVDFGVSTDDVEEFLPPQSEVSADLIFEGFQMTSAAVGVGGAGEVNVLLAEQPLPGAHCHVDGASGTISVDAVSAPFRHGFLFSALSVRVRFPRGLPGNTSELTYVLLDSSHVSVRYTVDALVFAAVAVEEREPFVLVQDLEPPVWLGCPSSQTVVAAPGEGHVDVQWSIPAIDDNRPQGLRTSVSGRVGAANYEGSLQPPARFVVRPRAEAAVNVTYAARDEYGNRAFCSFAVLVEDREPPTLVCAAVHVALPPGRAEVDVAFAEWAPAVEDSSNLATRVVVPGVGILRFRHGNFSTRTRVADDWGNEAQCNTTFLVVDLEPPAVECPPDSTFAAAPNGLARVVWTLPRVRDNSGENVTLTSRFQSGTFFEAGEYNISYSGKDTSGNVANCTFRVEVQPAQSSSSALASSAIAGVASGTSLLVLAVIVMAVVVHRQIQKGRQPANWDEIFALIEQFRNGSGEGPRKPRELPRSWVKIVEELGRGAFGEWVGFLGAGRRQGARSNAEGFDFSCMRSPLGPQAWCTKE
jgi:hypothetical protein